MTSAKTPTVRELAKFAVVGVLTFLVTVAGSFLLHVHGGIGPLTSGLLAMVLGTALSYAANRYWTFRHRQRIGIRRESLRYAALGGTGLVIQLSCVALMVYVLGQHGAVAYEGALTLGTGLGAAFRFWSLREWVWPPHPATAGSRPVPC